MSKELIRLKNLVMEFDGERILDNINLYINDHEFLTLLGPSGCGKTTLLSLLGGLDSPTSGSILFEGKDIAQGGLARPSEKECFLYLSELQPD